MKKIIVLYFVISACVTSNTYGMLVRQLKMNTTLFQSRKFHARVEVNQEEEFAKRKLLKNSLQKQNKVLAGMIQENNELLQLIDKKITIRQFTDAEIQAGNIGEPTEIL